MTIDNTEDIRGDWPLWTLWLIPIVLGFAGLVGACAPEAHADEPTVFDHAFFEFIIEGPNCDRDVECIVRAVFPDHLEERAWLVVAGPTKRCKTGESAGQYAPKPHRNRNGSIDHGPFQMNSGNRRALIRAGFDWEAVKTDPWENARAALWLYENTRNAGRNWSCSPWRSWSS